MPDNFTMHPGCPGLDAYDPGRWAPNANQTARTSSTRTHGAHVESMAYIVRSIRALYLKPY